MARSELVERIAEEALITREQARAALDGFCLAVSEAVVSGRDVRLPKFGVFRRWPWKRKRLIDWDGNERIVRAHHIPKFFPSKDWKRRVKLDNL